jgi:hypothetical protein
MTKEEKVETFENSGALLNMFHAENKLKFLEFCADTKFQRGTHLFAAQIRGRECAVENYSSAPFSWQC